MAATHGRYEPVRRLGSERRPRSSSAAQRAKVLHGAVHAHDPTASGTAPLPTPRHSQRAHRYHDVSASPHALSTQLDNHASALTLRDLTNGGGGLSCSSCSSCSGSGGACSDDTCSLASDPSYLSDMGCTDRCQHLYPELQHTYRPLAGSYALNKRPKPRPLPGRTTAAASSRTKRRAASSGVVRRASKTEASRGKNLRRSKTPRATKKGSAPKPRQRRPGAPLLSFETWARRKDSAKRLQETAEQLQDDALAAKVRDQLRLREEKQAKAGEAYEDWRKTKSNSTRSASTAATTTTTAAAADPVKEARRPPRPESKQAYSAWVRQVVRRTTAVFVLRVYVVDQRLGYGDWLNTTTPLFDALLASV